MVRNGDKPSGASTTELVCGHSAYGPERIREAVRDAHAGIFGALPHDWSIAGAVVRPLRQDELKPILPTLVMLKERDRWDNETYPLRMATLTLWLANDGPWDRPTRHGTAWANLLAGMLQHHFDFRKGQEHVVMCPSPVLFDGDVATLDAIIRRTYVDRRGNRRRWLRQQLDSRRKAAEAERLNRLLIVERARRHPAYDRKTASLRRAGG
jgi:hypothetical protein